MQDTHSCPHFAHILPTFPHNLPRLNPTEQALEPNEIKGSQRHAPIYKGWVVGSNPTGGTLSLTPTSLCLQGRSGFFNAP